MARRLQSFRFDESKYERPEQKWVCGRMKSGDPCQIGPDGKGNCRATYECSPVQDGDRWKCARPKQWGGTCDQGPRPDGTCCNPIPKCEPDRSVRSKRGMAVLGAAAVTVGLGLFLLGGPLFEDTRRSVVSSGELSRNHGAIESCALCHASNEEMQGEMPQSETGEAGSGEGSVAAAGAGAGTMAGEPGQARFCLQCHEPMDGNVGAPHGLSEEVRAAMTRELERDTTAGSRPFALTLAALGPDPMENGRAPSCATCHEEHRGQDADLTRVSNNRCQSCHTVQFASFRRGHPELDGPEPLETLPYGFDHGAHESEHFPDEDAEFTCAGCHSPAPSRVADLREAPSMETADFQAMCSDCHSQEIRRNGVVMFQLPGVDYEILQQQSGISVGTWPVDAGIDLVTPMSPVMRTLLRADPRLRDDLDMLQGVDLFFLPEDDPELHRAAGNVAWGVKGLFHDLLNDGRESLAGRIEEGLGVELTEAEAAALVDQRSTDERRPLRPEWLPLLRTAQQAWLPGLHEEVAGWRGGATPPLDVYEEYDEPRTDAERWLIDWDFTVRYLPEGHADPFLKTLLEVSGRAADDGEVAGRVFASMSGSEAPGACGKCHTLEAAEAETDRGLWSEARVHAPPNALTRFDHGPHLVVNCQSCHAVDAEGRYEPTPKRTCASCHTRSMASASCLNCHRYHAEGFTRSGEQHPMTRSLMSSQADDPEGESEEEGAQEGGGDQGEEGSDEGG